MNKNEIWQLLDKELKDYPEDFGGMFKNPFLIKEAETQLSLQFSNSYNFFLEQYGSAVLLGHIIYGLIPLTIMGNSIKNVVDKTLFYKETQKWPGIADWYVVSDDGFGNPIGIDAEGKVWLSDHDSGFEKVKLADSFEEFLYKLLTNTLYE